MACARCGRETTGHYCESCRFYENNDQCWRCRMYLPKVELQYWRGQLYCPYCVLDIRDGEKRDEEEQSESARISGRAKGDAGVPPEDRPFGPGVQTDYGAPGEQHKCDRCRGELDMAYVVADHKFCELCFQQQTRNWRKKGIKQLPYLKYRVRDDLGLFSKLIGILKHRIAEEWEKRNRKNKGKEVESKKGQEPLKGGFFDSDAAQDERTIKPEPFDFGDNPEIVAVQPDKKRENQESRQPEGDKESGQAGKEGGEADGGAQQSAGAARKQQKKKGRHFEPLAEGTRKKGKLEA